MDWTLCWETLDKIGFGPYREIFILVYRAYDGIDLILS